MPGKMDGKASRAEDDDFSEGLILPPLVIQLRKILDQYSDETQIFKELIQNAEDAGASEVRFLYDRRQYGQDPRHLHHRELAKFQGPALYAYNNAVFDDEDWKGIRMLSQSIKHSDPLKVGHFGIGFKSVFHLTDIPSVLSGDKLGMIDPQQFAFPASSHGWNLSKHSKLLSTIPHQLEPFIGTFDCDAGSFRSGFYRGTMFRFPLRTQPSALSSSLYNEEKMRELLENFEADARHLLLFLRSVERISIYERDRTSKTCRLVYRVELSDSCVADVRKTRSEFVEKLRDGAWQDRTLTTSSHVTITTESFRDRSTTQRQRFNFLVTNYCCGGQVSPLFRNLFRDPELGYLPWVGAAMSLDASESDVDGRLFCFLPLPLEANSVMGLPVHIHGFFALEQNRKYVKWPGTYSFADTYMDKGLLWNQCLLREAVPKAYAGLLCEAVRLHAAHSAIGITVPVIYHAFANYSSLERRWEPVITTVYLEMLKHPMVYHSSSDVGEWIEAKNAIFNNLEPSDEVSSVVMGILLASNVNVVTVPAHVLAAIRRYAPFSLNLVSPTLVASAYQTVQTTLGLHWESKMKLLRYLLRQSKYELLDNLELLPLANGGFDVFHFNPKKADRTIYIVTSTELQTLLPGLKDDFLEIDIDDDIKNMLMKAANRGYTQLKVLDVNNIGKLLHKCMPTSWLNGRSKVVEWNPAEFGHPPAGWLESVWLFLINHASRDLGIVNGLPLIPSRTIERSVPGRKEPEKVVELVQLSTDQTSLARSLDGLSLSRDVEEVVRLVGVTVVDELPDYVKSHPLVLKLYVFSPTYIGVLRALERQCASDGQDVVVSLIADNATVEQKRALRQLFSKMSVYELSRDFVDLLVQLPLFEAADGSGRTSSDRGGGPDSSTFVSASMISAAAPAEKLPFRMSRPLLDTTSPDAQSLGKLLGVKSLNMAQLLVQVVFPDVEAAFYEHSEVQAIMLYVLRHYHFLADVDQNFRKTLRSLPFMLKGDMLTTIDRFYDPDHELLQKLFLFEENFPSGEYSDPSIVAVLREIGLRGVEDVEPEDLLESACTIQQLYGSAVGNSSRMQQLIEKSDALLEYLHRHKSRLRTVCSGTEKTLASTMSDVCWVRSMATRPTFYPQSVRWHGGGHVFFKPSEMVVRASINLVGSVQPVVAAEIYAEVSMQFGWDRTPLLENIVAHFANVVSSYDPRDKVIFMEMSRSVYSELSKHDCAVVAGLLNRHDILSDWIWHGDGFSRPSRMVVSCPFTDLRPYVYSLPTEMSVFAEFFTAFGVQAACDLLQVLATIKDKYGTDDEPPRTPGGSQRRRRFLESELKRDLYISVCLLNELKSYVVDDASLKALQPQIFVPVHCDARDTLKLAPLLRCSYCDDEWLRQGYSTTDLSTSVDDQLHLVHPNVPSSTAEALGIPTLMSKMLEAEELEYSFGQTDSLTHRLNTLLDDYSDGFAVPKELVQNADDAGATEVRFLYDERTNADSMSCLIDEGMKECHGPAFWVYNNATFTDEDFENITKLNGATKESQTDKIGRFGLGFNAVYNLTDVPSFVSRHCIVIFDPHTTYLGKSIRNKSKPGLKLDMRKHRRKLRSLGNQFKPFNDVFGCDLRPTARQDCYAGTLFRLPLRTKTQAERSEICQKHYDDAEMKSLLRQLIAGADNLLMFTQNVLSVSVHHLASRSASPADMTEMFRIVKKPMRIVRELNPVVVKINDVYKSLDREMQHFLGQCSMLRSATDVMRHVRKGVKPDRLSIPDHSFVMRLQSSVSVACEAFLSVHVPSGHQDWLVSGCLGRNESLRMALEEIYLIPTASVAVPVQAVPSSSSYVPVPLTDPADVATPHGVIFAYMPLPIRSGLPVHINAMFSVTANRRCLSELNEDDKTDSRGALWNEILLRDAVTSAYIKLLCDLAALSPANRPCQLHLLWPRSDQIATKCLADLLTSFYQELGGMQGHKPALFSDGRRWASIDDAVFLDCPYTTPELNTSLVEVCKQCCVSNTSSVVVRLPDWVQQEFQTAEVDHLLAARTYSEVDFFGKMFLPNIDMIALEDRDKLLIAALTRNDAELNRVIKEFHCIPVTPDGTRLRQPTKLVDPSSRIAQLYLPGDARFPFGLDTYARSDIADCLRKIGMKRNPEDLTWAEIIDRAHLISGIRERATAYRMVEVFLDVVGEKLADNSAFAGLRQIQQQLMEIAFIPAAEKSPHFPLKWVANEDHAVFLYKPSELFPPECKDLVGCNHLAADASVFANDCTELLTFLRLGLEWKEPTIVQVLEQLDVITNPNTENYFQDGRVLDEVQNICYSIYTYFQTKAEGSVHRQTLQEALANRYFILADGRFLSPKQLAFEFTSNCSPYLYAVPEIYRRHYSGLLRVAGVRDRFEAKDFVNALHGMHDIYDVDPLDKDELRLALQIVSLLNECITDKGLAMSDLVAKHGTIYVPDSRNVLCSATDLCYNEPDCQWVQPADRTASRTAASFSHPLIPYSMSQQLGVSTKRQEVLKKHSRGIPFGQREALTNRIKRILSGYPCDKEILKELLQNADDAGATEIHFVKDTRQHGTERIFDQSWKLLQGPALCVYNNRPFTDGDLKGIQMLGQGSKVFDPNKTGQYGVGFNCVYHLTDVPSFLTKGREVGETLCVFDPHARFVPGATTEEPGRRYDNIPQLRPIFTDIFPCYLEDFFDLNGGTMFRFPLRTEQMAKDSDLSEQAISNETIDQLFDKFRSEVFDCLLFVNNVTSISLSQINAGGRKLSNSYNVTVRMSDFDLSVRQQFYHDLGSVAKQIQSDKMTLDQIPVKEAVYKMSIIDSEGYEETWLVSQRIGLDNDVKVPQCVTDAVRGRDLALLPRGGVAALLDSRGEHRPSRVFCFLPLPVKTDLPVHVNGHFALDHEARRNLWQDDDRGTKTEWNYMLVKEVIAPAYVSLLRRIPAYLSSSILSENISLMDSFGEEIPNLDAYSKLFPLFGSQMNKGYWRSLIEMVYQRIDRQQEVVFPVVRPCTETGTTPLNAALDNSISMQLEVEWISTAGDGASRPFFDNLTETFSKLSDDRPSLSSASASRRRRSRLAVKKPQHEVLRNILLTCGFKIIRLPLHIYDSFQAAGVDVRCVTPRAVIDFYALFQNGSCHCGLPVLPGEIGSTPFGTNVMLKIVHDYCSQDVAYFRSHLSGLPLLLCEDGQLRQFASRDRVFLSSHHEVLPNLGSMFIHHSYVGTIFKDVDIDSCDVFRRFDVAAFASFLSTILPGTQFRWKTGQPAARWDREDDVPSERWLCLVWNFLYEEYERVTSQHTVNEVTAARSLLEPLKDWCLIPAFTTTSTKSPQRQSPSLRMSLGAFDVVEHYLVPLSLADMVLDYSQMSIMSSSVRQCFGRIGIPELNCALLDGSSSKKGSTQQLHSHVGGSSAFVRLLVSSLEQPVAVLKALQYALVDKSRNTKHFGQVPTPEECLVMLKYFSDAIELWQDNETSCRTLRSLPIHLAVHGNLVSLGVRSGALLMDDIPSDGMEHWQRSASLVLLRPCYSLIQLYQVLDCPCLKASEVYMNHVFPNFYYLTAEASLAHMQFIRDYKLPQLHGDEKSSFVASLSELAFLPLDDGRFHRASEFFDPHHPVFKVMMQSDAATFPASPFSDYGWLEFLRLAGMQAELSSQTLVEFAQRIADRAKSGATEQLLVQSRTLVTHLLKLKDLPLLDLLDKVANIPFIPPAKANSLMTRIYPPFNQGYDNFPFITFSEGVPVEHELLVWTSAYLLPEWANPFKLTQRDVSLTDADDDDKRSINNYRQRIAELLGICEHPAVNVVVDHIQNICGVTMGKSDEAHELRSYVKTEVMTRVYKFLQSCLVDAVGEIPRDEQQKVIQRLSETPFIVSDIGQTFVRPRQVVVSLYEDDQIYPYLITMPTELGEFKRLFLHLGATMSATAPQYAMVLESMYVQTGGEKLHPNELRLAFKAVHGLFSALKKHRHTDTLARVHTLYLPTRIGHLFRSTEIVFVDDTNYADRIRYLGRPFLVDLNECWLTAENHEDTVKLLPQRLRPLMLSAVVQETLEDRSRDTIVLHTVADKLKYQISSRPFAQGLLRLIRNEHRRSGHRVRQTAMDSIEQHLRKIHVYGVERVVTFLDYNGQRLTGSETECECFVDKKVDEDSGIETWTIYINKSICLSEELQVSVAEVINRMTGRLLKNSVHYIQPILACPPHSIMKVLDRLQVRPDHCLTDGYQPTLPTPGTFIPIEDHHLLKEDFEEFDMGEYVGYEVDDDDSGMPVIIYAMILERIEEEEFYHVRRSESEEHAACTHRRFTQQYRINIGEDRQPTVAVSTDLYKFHRVDGFVSSRGGSTSDQFGRRGSIGQPKSPKPNYRESFYRSSMFEPEEMTPSSSAKPWERSPADMFQSGSGPAEDGEYVYNEMRSAQYQPAEHPADEVHFTDDLTDYSGYRRYIVDENDSTRPRVHTPVHPDDAEFETIPEEQTDFESAQQANGMPDLAGDDGRAADQHSPGMVEEEEITVEQVMLDVSDTLEEAWRLSEGQRKKIIKRMLLKWHPDKNIGNEEFATIIMQHIQAEIERLELGLPRPANFNANDFNFDPRNPFSASESFQRNFASAYQFFFEQMNQRAKEHREQRERYQENFSREYSAGRTDYNFDVPPTFSSVNPQPAQAKRFLRQAQEDVRAADNDYDAEEPAFEWVCFKAHQAAEKALKAAQFSVDAVTSFSHDLVTLAASLEDPELRRLAQKLQKIVGNSNKLYNPDPIDFVVIPHEEYSREMACDAVMCAVDVLERVKEFVELRDNS